MHCNDVIRGEIGHSLGQIDQGGGVVDHICIRLLRRKKPGGKWTLHGARGPGGRGTVWSSRGGRLWTPMGEHDGPGRPGGWREEITLTQQICGWCQGD
jgi:hypothetical protein